MGYAEEYALYLNEENSVVLMNYDSDPFLKLEGQLKNWSIFRLKIKGSGTFLAYSNKSPKKCVVIGGKVKFMWYDQSKIEFHVTCIDVTGDVSESACS
ncbi:Stachyose synthase, partial [Bienertia sinuspersici]